MLKNSDINSRLIQVWKLHCVVGVKLYETNPSYCRHNRSKKGVRAHEKVHEASGGWFFQRPSLLNRGQAGNSLFRLSPCLSLYDDLIF
jgi:hypothetical protein